MQAVLCEHHGKPETLVLKNIDSLKPAKNEVIISVKACGVNFPDTLIIQNLYQFKPGLPFSPGGEVSGLVKAIGSEVKNVKVGDKVFALCGWGGFAEEVKVTADKVVAMLPEMDFVSAAALSYNYGTSYHALKDRANLKKDETLLVLGAAGGVGLAAVELGRLMGAKVIAAASTAQKLAICKSKGADLTINYQEEDLKTRVKELTDGKGVDVVYDPVGDRWAEPALRSMAWKGRYLVVGFAGGQIPKMPLNLTLLKGCSIVGVFWGRFANAEPENSMQNLKELGQYFLSGKLKPHISRLYSLAEAPQALKDLMNRKVIGKAVVSLVNSSTQLEQKAQNVATESHENVSTSEIENNQPTNKDQPSKTIFHSLQEVKNTVGKPLGVSQWLTVSQEMINDFAKTTQDEQWIHTDLEKAKASPFGGTIAHGYLTLSLIPKMMADIYESTFTKMGVNYGTEKVRFTWPIPSGSRIRVKAVLKHVSEVANNGIKMIVEATIEIEGEEKPACYAELITVQY